jgi:hypothetical protein
VCFRWEPLSRLLGGKTSLLRRGRDISNFSPRILPDNKYLRELQEETQNSVHKFIESVDCGEYVGSILYERYRDYCVEEGMVSFSNTKFSKV